MRDVEALDADRQRVETERLLQPVERLDPLLPAPLGLQLLLLEREPRVALGEVEDPALAAALGGADLDAAAAPLGQDLLEDRQLRALRERRLDDDQRRDRERARVVLEDELLGDDRRRLLALVLEVERLAVGQHAVADLEDLRVGLGALDVDRHRVVGAGALVGDALALEQRADGLQAVAVERGALVVLLARVPVHAVLEIALDLLEAPAQERDHAVDPLPVLLLGHVADAGRPAALDVVVEAGGAGVAARLGALAAAQLEDLAQQVERAAHALGARVGAEVDAVAPVPLAREVDARELLVEADRDVGVRLVVAQPDVEARLVLLDEGLLGEQRLRLGGDHERLEVVDLVGQRARAVERRICKMACNPLPERLRLAHVDDAPAGVAEQVDPGLVGEASSLLGEPPRAVLVCGFGLYRHAGL